MTTCRFLYEPISPGITIAVDPEVTSRFDVPWSTTRDDLDYEAVALGASTVILQLDVERSRIRQDGFLRADAKVDSPRVRITLDTRHGPLTLASGRYRRPSNKRNSPQHWQHNARAIVKTLEALRAVERYDVAQTGEQYRGFLALEATPTAPSGGWDLDTADGATAWLVARAEQAGHTDAYRMTRGGLLRAVAAIQLDPDDVVDLDQVRRTLGGAGSAT